MSMRNGKMKYLAIGAAGLIAAGGMALDATSKNQEKEKAVLTTFGVTKAEKEKIFPCLFNLHNRVEGTNQK